MLGFSLNKTIAASLLLFSLCAKAQEEKVAILIEEEEEKSMPLLRGIAVSADIVAPIMNTLSDNGGYEAALRFNLKDKYFPVFELGVGTANRTDEETSINYKTTAPYCRMGVDFNMLRNKNQGNRLFIGFRGAYSTFEYDYTSPIVKDPVWDGTVNIDMKGRSSNAAWLELIFGIEAEVLKDIHMGWTARYKSRLHQKTSDNGEAWYIPGFGINGSTRFGATYSIIFDLPLAKRNKQTQK